MNARTMQLRADAQSDRNAVRETFRQVKAAVKEMLDQRALKKKAAAEPAQRRQSRDGLAVVQGGRK